MKRMWNEYARMRSERELCEHLGVTKAELEDMPAQFVEWVQRFRNLPGVT